MADTERSYTDLNALLADNSAGDISAQDMRDVLISLLGGLGIIYVFNGSTAQSSIGLSDALVTGFTTDGLSRGITTAVASDKLTIGSAGYYFVAFYASFSGTASTVFTFTVYQNTTGTQIRCDRTIGTGGDVGTTMCFGILSCAAADDLSVQVKADGASKSITPVHMALFAKKIG